MRWLVPAWLARVPGFTPGERSLHRHLLLWLLLPQLLLWGAAAFFTFQITLSYADRGLHAMLDTVSEALMRQINPPEGPFDPRLSPDAKALIESSPRDPVAFSIDSPPGHPIDGNATFGPLPAQVSLTAKHIQYYDATLTVRGRVVPMRVGALIAPVASAASVAAGQPEPLVVVRVARSRIPRENMVRDVLVDIVLPLSGLLLVVLVVVWAGIHTGLAPLARLRELVRDRQPHDLAPLEVQSAPEEVRALAQALNRLLAAVQASVASQRRFISHAAHQLRTPLAGVKSQVELAMGLNHDPAVAERLQRVHASAVQGAHVVRQMLALSQAEPEAAGRQTRERVDLRRLGRDVTAALVPQAVAAGIDLGWEDHTTVAELTTWGVPLLLQEALSNVIDNAIRYAGRDSEITVHLRQPPDRADQAVIEVDDNGPGIAEADQTRVFERFVRATTTGPGCGLGLAIVKEIVEHHGGQVALHTLAPHGLQVRLTFPLSS